ncbi:MAG: hypothetical protein AVDCRST_MAG05-4666 [uncultured Rubrobacteraceae bacterium]|uniref:Uncharacterized protein n=1 Tax=uncultured Rubrobacteraceae bacterium TaxID=349277 RepID=A0A6J4TXW9_9ACTN|nr:MAG: hypothetical protein AVDCRST_MAG05-4666 [uncultured Rubrobacteraceae bacterium]
MTAHGVPGFVKSGCYGPSDMGEITSSDAFIDNSTQRS